MSKCTKCGNKTRKGDVYCSWCGKKIDGTAPAPGNSSKQIALIVIIALSAAIFMALLYFQSGPEKPRLETETEHIPEHDHEHPVFTEQTIKVAGNFMCPCGNCWDNLATCGCEHPNGSIDSKSLIQNMLQQGNSEDLIVGYFTEKYGQRILASSADNDESNLKTNEGGE